MQVSLQSYVVSSHFSLPSHSPFLDADTYIVVKKDLHTPDTYEVGVTIKDGVKRFGPSFPFPALIHKSILRQFLVTKSELYG
jgi:hypothetical protein